MSQVAYLNVLNNDLLLIARCGKACDKKAYSDLNYVEHKTIHMEILFARSRESKRENSRHRNLTHNDSVLIRIKCL